MTKEYISSAEQLERWVKGESVHRLMANGGDECCPDFSCCHPQLLADEEIRKAFAEADEKQRMGFLGNFLGAALSKLAPSKEVYIAGVTDPADRS